MHCFVLFVEKRNVESVEKYLNAAKESNSTFTSSIKVCDVFDVLINNEWKQGYVCSVTK